MSESASDQKVEDVLSSVRRLISQEVPKRPEPTSGAADGALVLTSQDRIAAEQRVRSEPRSLEQRVAELEAAVDGGAQEFEPDGSEDQAQHRPDRIVFTRPRPSEVEVGRPRTTLRLSEIALVENVEDEVAEDVGEKPVEFKRQASREAPMAEDVPTLPQPSAEVRPFSDPDDVVARIEARIEKGEEPHVAPLEPTRVEHDEASGDAGDFDAALSAAVLASMAGAQARDKAEVGDTLDPEEVSSSVALSDSVSEDTASSDILQPIVDVPIAASSASDVEDFMDDLSTREVLQDQGKTTEEPSEAVHRAVQALDALPSEEALRVCVARMMREELRGELGEQITHNVRKLVRSEIFRVLQSRELD